MKTYGVGIIGCGAIFIMHAYPLHRLESAEIKAVCDIKPTALQSASQLFHCGGYQDYNDMLKRDDIDVVHILTPHYLHAPMAIDAAYTGKHVLLEKPMVISMDQAHAIIAAGKRNHVTIGVISQNRYNAAAKAIKAALNDGSLGKVISQRIILSWAKPSEYYKSSDWRGTWDKEGGALLIDQSIHVMDLARWLIDEEIQSVQASIANRDHPEIDTKDTAEGLITYRNGVKSVFFGTNNFGYNALVLVETQCEHGTALMEFDRAIITYQNGQELTVVNDPKDTINEADYQNFFNEESSQSAMRILKEWGIVMFPVTWKSPKSYWGASHNKQIENFYSSLAAGKQPDITADVAIKTQELIMAIYQSAKEKRTIEF